MQTASLVIISRVEEELVVKKSIVVLILLLQCTGNWKVIDMFLTKQS